MKWPEEVGGNWKSGAKKSTDKCVNGRLVQTKPKEKRIIINPEGLKQKAYEKNNVGTTGIELDYILR